MLNGIEATRDHFEAVAETIVRGAQGFGHNTFKIELARRAVIRALQHATRTQRGA
jgi:xanthine dehydrogenase YagS FAD-binding subunit